MRRGGRVALSVIGGLALAVIAASVIVSQLIDLAPLRQRVVARLSASIGSAVELETLRIGFWPTPHLIAERMRFGIPGTGDAAVASVSAYPKLSALLRGKLQLDVLHLMAPDVKIRWERSTETPTLQPDGSARTLQDTIAAALAAASSAAAAQAPGLAVAIDNGRVSLSLGDGRALLFTDIQAEVRLPPEQWSLTATCAGDLWERLALNVSLDARTLTGSGSLDVSRLRPQLLTAGLLPDGGLQLGDSEVNLTLHASADQTGHLRAGIDGSMPVLRLHRGANSLDLRADHISATAQRDDNTATVTITDWRSTAPQAQISGELVLDQRTPAARVKLEGRDVDVRSVMPFSTLLADVPVVRQIFDILQGGTVPTITVQAEGPTLADLGQMETLAIRGHLSEGTVHVPGVDLDLRDVAGDVAIAQGVLSGDHLAARLGNSQAQDGSLRLGLTGSAPELRVETTVQADAAELPPLLRRLVASDALTRELDHISDVQGTATGKLLLTGTTNDVRATVDVSPFKVSGRLDGMKQRVQVAGGRFTYDAGGVNASDVAASVGGSTLSQLAARIDWSRPRATFEASAGNSRVILDDIYPWLSASGWLRDSPWNPQALSGALTVQSLKISGPAATPSDWRFELVGAAENLDVESRRLQRHIAIRYPVSLHKMRLVGDAATGVSFAGEFAAPGGLTGAIDLLWNASAFTIKQLSVRDAQSDAKLSLAITPGAYDLSLVGTLTKSTLDALIPDSGLLGGSIDGNFQAHIVVDQPTRSTAEGRLTASDVFLPGPNQGPLRLATLSLDANAGIVVVDATAEIGAQSHLHVLGSVKPSTQTFIADLDVTAERFDWSALEPLLPGSSDTGESSASSGGMAMRGTVRFTAEAFTYRGFTWKPLHATVILTPTGTTVKVTEANLCGIVTPGTITATSSGLNLAFKPVAKRQSVNASLRCLGDTEQAATGRYDLSGDIAAQGPPANLLKSARGRVQVTATDGRLYQLGVTAKVLSALNVATGALGDIGDLTKDGLPYSTSTLKADLREGVLIINEATLDGSSVKMVSQGSVNLTDGALDCTVLILPLKRVDVVVSHIPIVSDILGGTLVSIPVKVTGDLANPTVTPLSPSVVGDQLIGLMTRTIKLPMKLIEPEWWWRGGKD